ncbi:MAG: flagellar basal body rod protein FlgC [bacterium]
MSLFDALTTSGSGMTAERLRMEVSADNLANANSTRTEDGGPYKRKVVRLEPRGNEGISFPDIASDSSDEISVPEVTGPSEEQVGDSGIPGMNTGDSEAGDGVRVTGIVESDGEPRRVYKPDHPDANEKGYVLMPNVEPVKEMVDMMGASRAYEANVSAIQSTKSMFQQSLRIMQ